MRPNKPLWHLSVLTDYFGYNAYRPSVMAHHAWVRTLLRLPMSRRNPYTWNGLRSYRFCLWVIYDFVSQDTHKLTREHTSTGGRIQHLHLGTTYAPRSNDVTLSYARINDNNCIPVPLLPPYPPDGWNIRRAAYTGLTPTWGTSSLIMTVYYFNASHLKHSLVPRGVLEAFRPTFGH